jgi:hypothetical protein
MANHIDGLQAGVLTGCMESAILNSMPKMPRKKRGIFAATLCITWLVSASYIDPPRRTPAYNEIDPGGGTAFVLEMDRRWERRCWVGYLGLEVTVGVLALVLAYIATRV